MISNDIGAVQPAAVLNDSLWQRTSRLSSLPSYHRRSLPCVREQPFAARYPAAVSRGIRAAQSSSKLKDLFWTRTSRLFTPLSLSSPLSAVWVLIMALCRMLLRSG